MLQRIPSQLECGYSSPFPPRPSRLSFAKKLNVSYFKMRKWLSADCVWVRQLKFKTVAGNPWKNVSPDGSSGLQFLLGISRSSTDVPSSTICLLSPKILAMGLLIPLQVLCAVQMRNPHILAIFRWAFSHLCLQCFDSVGWAAGRASSL